MTAATRYLAALGAALSAIGQQGAVEDVAARTAASLLDGGVLHLFGSGHSQLVALEAAGRAGGLAAVHPIAPAALSPVEGARAALAERLPGFAATLLAGEDLRAGEVVVVVSHSGINAVPIEVALSCADRGLHVVAVTSLAHSAAVASRHPSGARLHEVAATVIDTGAPVGDTATTLSDGTPLGPVSTILAAAVVHAIACRAAEVMAEHGARPPVLVSQNLGADGPGNAEVLARYASRLAGPGAGLGGGAT